ncbi:hypothetical protein E9549_05315 [Blastococcus sp. MG754426]|uniref:hypothetical protein n=1 Tax=unclassified Blastococcus TaxID=2619396 RepID=UPI001EF0336A|nr:MULTISPECIES: hypothetical protein [unclassified Blastococcus]MCF6506827.1 hypothetical protein [Blastococcus sp. MG754426]MCF6511627.1 hypothetical protein [Blastococcus sp. MG754427]MCF6733723.1 hypothetical protein [Blastococcus sp. KM273129]
MDASTRPLEVPVLLRVLGFLLVAWLVLSVVGAVLAVVEGLIWLLLVGVLLLLATAAYGRLKRDDRV